MSKADLMEFVGSDKKEDLAWIGILVCQPQSVLAHKLRDGKESDGRYCYWEFTHGVPKRVGQLMTEISEDYVAKDPQPPRPLFDYVYDDDKEIVFSTHPYRFYVRVYFAVGGVVRGFFKSYAADHEMQSLRFHSEDWVPIKNGSKIKPSQGYRYVTGELKGQLEKLES